METSLNQKSERQFYIDWLRILLIISVFLFHIGMVFNTWEWHIKNDQLYGGILIRIMSFLHIWRMPLFFLISGAGTFFALGQRTPVQYLSERFKRLFIPLVAGVFILVPVQVYIERVSEYKSLIDFYTHMFEGVYPSGNFSWHHLWFIAYLFVIALIITPFLTLLRSRKFVTLTGKLEGIVTKPFALNLFIVPLLLSQIILRNFFEVETHSLVNDWASMTLYIIFFIAGYILLPNKNIAEAIRKQRLYYLSETIILTIIMFSAPGLFSSERTNEIIYDVSELIITWTCSIAVIGYAKHYLNFNTGFRKIGNEAIFPFYLLHQPVIVVTGYFLTRCEIPVLLKVILIAAISFLTVVILYWLIIRRVRFLRQIFGMKPDTSGNKKYSFRIVLRPLIPVLVKPDNSKKLNNNSDIKSVI